jgi:DNA primase
MKSEIKRNYDYTKLVKEIDIIQELEKREILGKESGDNFMCLCPLHGESNPSFGIRFKGDKKGLWNCLGCGETGNWFSLISKLDNIRFSEAVGKYNNQNFDLKFLNRLEKFFIDGLMKEKKKKSETKIKVYKKKFMDKFINPSGKFLKYLKNERKLTEKTINKFNIKCCNGLGTGYGMKWVDRIVIPIEDEKGRLIGATARYIEGCDKSFKVRKITHSDISKVLFGLRHIKDKKVLVLEEGELDVVRSIQEGVPAVITGKHPSIYQIQEILKYTNNVVYVPDGDVPWENKKSPKDCVSYQLKRLKKYFNVDYIKLPNNEDPNSLPDKEFKKIFKDYINKDNIK